MKTRELNQNMEIDSVEEAEEILKAAGTEDIFEKAHVHGEVHPNGRWYWDSQASGGKGDWRIIKKQRGENKEETTSGGKGEKDTKKIAEDLADFYENDIVNSKLVKIFEENDRSDIENILSDYYYKNSDMTLFSAKNFAKKVVIPELENRIKGYKNENKTSSTKNNKSETGANKERKALENFFKLEDEYYENDEASTEEISKKMQKIIDSNDFSKRDFIRLYVKHGKDFAGGGGITNSDLKDSILNTIDILQLKFKK